MSGIIVGVDGSAHSQWAIEWATGEAVSRQVPLTALSVSCQGALSYGKGGLSLDQAIEEVQAMVYQVLSHRPGRVPAVTVGRIVGSPAAELVGASRDADLLVVGSRGNGGLGRRGLGSVSRQVACTARCPVVIIFQPASTHWTAHRVAMSQKSAGRSLVRAATATVASQP